MMSTKCRAPAGPRKGNSAAAVNLPETHHADLRAQCVADRWNGDYTVIWMFRAVDGTPAKTLYAPEEFAFASRDVVALAGSRLWRW
jgi:hypothetical protein